MTLTYPSTKEERIELVVKLLSIVRGDKLKSTDPAYLVKFLTLPEKYSYAPFSTAARRYLAAKDGVSVAAVNNHIYSLIDSGYIYRDTDNVLQINPSIKKLRNMPNQLIINLSEKATSDGIATTSSTAN